jgi:PEP-CTERM motif-containing protein
MPRQPVPSRTPVYHRSAFVVVIALLLFLLASQPLKADEVHIAGFTNGGFAANPPAASAITGGLTYSNSTFSGTTSSGFRGIGSAPNPGSNFNNLGSFSLSTAPQVYNTTFTLQVTFTAPQGINGSNQTTFGADVDGSVAADNQGGVFIDFNNTPVLFTFNDTNPEPDPTGGVPGQQTTSGTGSFFFSINDLAIDPGSTVSVTGQITGAQQVPEPATAAALVGAGLLAAARRRR